MDQVHAIRHEVLVEGLAVRAVAREMKVSRNTVRKYLLEAEPVRKVGRAKPRPVFDAVKPRVEALLEEWAGRATPKPCSARLAKGATVRWEVRSMQVNILEAKNQLSKLVKAAAAGEEIVIASNGKPMAKLVAIASRRRLGSWRSLKISQARIDAAFTQEVDDEVARALHGKP